MERPLTDRYDPVLATLALTHLQNGPGPVDAVQGQFSGLLPADTCRIQKLKEGFVAESAGSAGTVRHTAAVGSHLTQSRPLVKTMVGGISPNSFTLDSGC